jgi:hypothetical protein
MSSVGQTVSSSSVSYTEKNPSTGQLVESSMVGSGTCGVGSNSATSTKSGSCSGGVGGTVATRNSSSCDDAGGACDSAEALVMALEVPVVEESGSDANACSFRATQRGVKGSVPDEETLSPNSSHYRCGNTMSRKPTRRPDPPQVLAETHSTTVRSPSTTKPHCKCGQNGVVEFGGNGAGGAIVCHVGECICVRDRECDVPASVGLTVNESGLDSLRECDSLTPESVSVYVKLLVETGLNEMKSDLCNAVKTAYNMVWDWIVKNAVSANAEKKKCIPAYALCLVRKALKQIISDGSFDLKDIIVIAHTLSSIVQSDEFKPSLFLRERLVRTNGGTFAQSRKTVLETFSRRRHELMKRFKEMDEESKKMLDREVAQLEREKVCALKSIVKKIERKTGEVPEEFGSLENTFLRMKKTFLDFYTDLTQSWESLSSDHHTVLTKESVRLLLDLVKSSMGTLLCPPTTLDEIGKFLEDLRGKVTSSDFSVWHQKTEDDMPKSLCMLPNSDKFRTRRSSTESTESTESVIVCSLGEWKSSTVVIPQHNNETRSLAKRMGGQLGSDDTTGELEECAQKVDVINYCQDRNLCLVFVGNEQYCVGSNGKSLTRISYKDDGEVEYKEVSNEELPFVWRISCPAVRGKSFHFSFASIISRVVYQRWTCNRFNREFEQAMSVIFENKFVPNCEIPILWLSVIWKNWNKNKGMGRTSNCYDEDEDSHPTEESSTPNWFVQIKPKPMTLDNLRKIVSREENQLETLKQTALETERFIEEYEKWIKCNRTIMEYGYAQRLYAEREIEWRRKVEGPWRDAWKQYREKLASYEANKDYSELAHGVGVTPITCQVRYYLETLELRLQGKPCTKLPHMWSTKTEPRETLLRCNNMLGWLRTNPTAFPSVSRFFDGIPGVCKKPDKFHFIGKDVKKDVNWKTCGFVVIPNPKPPTEPPQECPSPRPNPPPLVTCELPSTPVVPEGNTRTLESYYLWCKSRRDDILKKENYIKDCKKVIATRTQEEMEKEEREKKTKEDAEAERERVEAERQRLHEEAEAAKAIQRSKAEKELGYAREVLASGQQGKDLVKVLREHNKRATPTAAIGAAWEMLQTQCGGDWSNLETRDSDFGPKEVVLWCPDNLGEFLKVCIYDRANNKQPAALFELQRCWVRAGKPKGVLKMLFHTMFQHELIEREVFFTWQEDTAHTEEKMAALFETNKWLQQAREKLDKVEDEDDSDSDDEE